jgi:hypothetical protein
VEEEGKISQESDSCTWIDGRKIDAECMTEKLPGDIERDINSRRKESRRSLDRKRGRRSRSRDRRKDYGRGS